MNVKEELQFDAPYWAVEPSARKNRLDTIFRAALVNLEVTKYSDKEVSTLRLKRWDIDGELYVHDMRRNNPPSTKLLPILLDQLKRHAPEEYAEFQAQQEKPAVEVGGETVEALHVAILDRDKTIEEKDQKIAKLNEELAVIEDTLSWARAGLRPTEDFAERKDLHAEVLRRGKMIVDLQRKLDEVTTFAKDLEEIVRLMEKL